LENEKRKNFSDNFISDKENFMKSFRKNVDMYASQQGITLKEISEKANIPFATLNNFLYNDTKDCKLSTAIALARAFEVSVDELVGSSTLSKEERSVLASLRLLPDSVRYLVGWFINRQMEIQKEGYREGKKMVPVVQLRRNDDGTLHITNDFRSFDISNVPDNVRPQIFMGIEMGFDNYMPLYGPYDILLIANDRKPQYNENSVLIYGDNFFIAHRQDNGSRGAEYHSIRDGKFLVNEKDVDDVIGYIAYKAVDTVYMNM